MDLQNSLKKFENRELLKENSKGKEEWEKGSVHPSPQTLTQLLLRNAKILKWLY